MPFSPVEGAIHVPTTIVTDAGGVVRAIHRPDDIATRLPPEDLLRMLEEARREPAAHGGH